MLTKLETPPIDALETDILTALVGRVLRISDITLGDDRRAKYLVRYRGQLYGEAAPAYDQLAASLRPYDITPVFRPTSDESPKRDQAASTPTGTPVSAHNTSVISQSDPHTILLMRGVIRPKPSNPWVNLILFVLTLASMVFTGALFAYDGPANPGRDELVRGLLGNLDQGLAFAASLLAILTAHEFGHYLAARTTRPPSPCPIFCPFPSVRLGQWAPLSS